MLGVVWSLCWPGQPHLQEGCPGLVLPPDQLRMKVGCGLLGNEANAGQASPTFKTDVLASQDKGWVWSGP